MTSGDADRVAQHAVTALLQGASPDDVCGDDDDYGAWAALIQHLLASHATGGTPAVVRAFDAVARAHHEVAALVAGTPALSSVPAPQAAPPLPTAATAVYDHLASCAAWLDAYVAFANQAAPMSTTRFHEAAGLYAVSVAIARRIALRVGTDAIYPNLFFLFIAPSTLYLKSTSFKVLRRLFQAADLTHLLLPQRMTPETLTQELGTTIPPTFSTWHVQLQERWVRERAFAAQRGWMLDEAARLLHSLKRDFNTGLTELILDLYECPDETSDQTISRGRTLVQQVYLSFFGATTPQGAAPHLANEELWHNGWWARFLLLTADTLPDWAFFPPELAFPPELVHVLQRVATLFPVPHATFVEQTTETGDQRRCIQIYGTQPPQSVILETGVYAAWERYTKAVRYDLLRAGVVPDVLWSCYGRLGTQLIKVAMCLAVLDTEHTPVVVELRHLARAQQLVEQWRAALHSLRTDGLTTYEAKTSDKIMALLADAGSTGLLARDIYRPLGLKAADARSMLEELTLAGQVVKQMSTAANGRTTELWRRAD